MMGIIENEEKPITSPLVVNKQSFASGLLDSKKRKRMGLPSEISFKKRTRRRRGKQKLRKKGK